MYTDSFKCAAAPDVAVDSPEGYALMNEFVKTLAAFLRDNGWDDRVVFHIHDEPDIHYRDDHTLRARRTQYLLTAGFCENISPMCASLKRWNLPLSRGGVDIWVPVTASYERQKAAFDQLTALGEPVWTYVCCTPEGHWLNRFLDFCPP